LIETRSAEETEAVGARLAEELGRGDVVFVSGDLGAGKTTLVRGACRQLGVREPITSPTFTIGARYQGDVPVSHVDLYRLEGLDSEDPGLLEDFLTPDAVAFVEWPAALEGLVPNPARRVQIEHSGGDLRTIDIR
jgi:tRNA threonylcarbamoyladenosine biosynthesis protein TsaE